MKMPADFNVLGSITGAHATQMLRKSIASHDVITSRGESVPVGRLHGFLKQSSELHIEAHLIPVSFWGGPPGKEDWWRGNLRMFLVDALMREEAKAGKANRDESFINEVVTSFKQRKHKRRKRRAAV